MKNKKTLLIRAAAVAVLVGIAALMMVIGRGHTVYIDNVKLEYNGETYETPYKVTVNVDGERVAKLYTKERGMATCIGDNFQMDLEVIWEKGGDEEQVTINLKLPHNVDGIIVNIPAVLAGLPQDAWFSEFVSAAVEEEETETEETTDDLGLGDEFSFE